MQFVTITSQGQVSIPAELRRRLNLDKTRKAIISADNDRIIIEPIKDILKLRGVFKTKKRIPFRVIRRAFEEAMGSGVV